MRPTEHFLPYKQTGEIGKKAVSKKSCIPNGPSKNLCLIINSPWKETKQAREATYTTLNIYCFDILLESMPFQMATNAE